MPSSYPSCPLCGGEVAMCFVNQQYCMDCVCGVRGPWRVRSADAEAGWERLCSLASERDRMRDACSRLNDSVCQTLGKALGYPPLYPDVSDVDDGSVCVGEHVAETIAAEAAERLASMVRLPPGVDIVEGHHRRVLWTAAADGEWELYRAGKQTDGGSCLTLQEACDQVRAELARLEGGDGE